MMIFWQIGGEPGICAVPRDRRRLRFEPSPRLSGLTCTASLPGFGGWSITVASANVCV
ncbi:hypothetical protein K438DRAFT_1805705 [Mycena galopus ATCC 62051]|nr:hypothetical protein K438DRAFT_1805705 [Mycena galopus ATCC 62051]